MANFGEWIRERSKSGEAQLISGGDGRTMFFRKNLANYVSSLIKAGLRKGRGILIICDHEPETAIMILATYYVGGVAIPCDLKTAQDLLSDQNHPAKSILDVVWDFPGNRLTNIKFKKIISKKDLVESGEEIKLEPCAKVLPDDIALLLRTSGSTKEPLYVAISHKNLICNTDEIIESQTISSDERALLVLPLNYSFGLSILHSHLAKGASIVLDGRFMFPNKVLQSMKNLECTTLAGVPTTFRIFTNRSKFLTDTYPNVKKFLIAGGAMSTNELRNLSAHFDAAKLYVMYGQTEATARITTLAPEDFNTKIGSVGRPLTSLSVKVVTPQGEELAAAQPGELIVSGKSIALGYFGDDNETSTKFKDGWLYTGDLASIDKEGFVWIKGRIDGFIKVAGVRISLQEVEHELNNLSSVDEGVVCVIDHLEAGKALALLAVKKKDIDDDSAIKEIRRKISSRWYCSHIKLIDDLPRTHTGKVSRKAAAENFTMSDDEPR